MSIVKGTYYSGLEISLYGGYVFQTKAGVQIPGISSADLLKLRSDLLTEVGINTTQIVEAASYSMAMVVRFALGLSAAGGRVSCIFEDTLSGWITLATVRHLLNGGGEAELIFIGDLEKASPDLEQQLNPLDKMGQVVTLWNNPDDNGHITSIIGSCHNCLCGYYELGRPIRPFEKNINELLNEMNTPIYTVEAPPGMDPDTGKSQGSPLYASCTLSLGAPLSGLVTGSDYAGRHYVCDISLTKDLYAKVGMDFAPVFSDQPVQQITPIKPEE